MNSTSSGYIISGRDYLYLFNTESLANQGSPSPPTTSARYAPVGFVCVYAYIMS
ncbi:hypothetical protein BV22DRAFT_1033155 [Leucogyrophana mollusca]|uniref:Uncharacterized protein n=1 Tax=Leucogyrophana mollusca TaxID=85980 RepID=A0ACB8BKV4_9AGAM|nr:hypothetical protein BV22DRAFT_1033155 [Leucogyrophana mollusca]